MGAGSMRICTLRGIEIRMHWSLIVIASLLTWSLADAAFPASADGYSTSGGWGARAADGCRGRDRR